MSGKTRFLLIRHGEIDANAKRLWHGSTDSDLNAVGIRQAEQMGIEVAKDHPNIAQIYSSPLKRTYATASALGRASGINPIKLKGLREYSIGELEGTSYQSLNEDHDFFNSISQDQDFSPKGGESVNGVNQRMLDVLKELAREHQGELIALVSHGAAMAIALASLLKGSPHPFHEYHMSNTGVTQLDWSDKPVLSVFDDTSHLSD